MHREDKKMRGHSNVTMCEWLINSFFTFLRLGDLHLVGPEGEDADIQIQEDDSVCLRGTTTLFLEFIFKRKFFQIIDLVAMKRQLSPLINSTREPVCRILNQTAFTQR